MNKVATATVEIGFKVITGLMHSGGAFGVPVPQVVEQFQLSEREQELLKVSPWPSVWATDDRSEDNILTLGQYGVVVMRLALSGSRKGQGFLKLMMGLGLYLVFSDAFRKLPEKQVWLMASQVAEKARILEWTEKYPPEDRQELSS